MHWKWPASWPRDREARLLSGVYASFPNGEINRLHSSGLLAGWASRFEIDWFASNKEEWRLAVILNRKLKLSRRSHPRPLISRISQFQFPILCFYSSIQN